jgi:hypothetical protein
VEVSKFALNNKIAVAVAVAVKEVRRKVFCRE